MVFEVSKHVFFKSFSKTILMLIMILIIFFVIISTLESENAIESNNPVIETGAAIVDSIKDQGISDKLEEKIDSLKEFMYDFLS